MSHHCSKISRPVSDSASCDWTTDTAENPTPSLRNHPGLYYPTSLTKHINSMSHVFLRILSDKHESALLQTLLQPTIGGRELWHRENIDWPSFQQHTVYHLQTGGIWKNIIKLMLGIHKSLFPVKKLTCPHLCSELRIYTYFKILEFSPDIGFS